MTIRNNPAIARKGFSDTIILGSNNDSLYFRNPTVAEQKEQIEELRESCFGAFERLLASYVKKVGYNQVMPTYQTLLPPNIYCFLNSMANLYSAIEKQMHVALLSGEKINVIEKRLQSEYQVDSTTVRNVYHDLKGKHSGILELRKTQIKEVKSTINSIKKSIHTQQKRYKTKLKKQQNTSKQRFIIH